MSKMLGYKSRCIPAPAGFGAWCLALGAREAVHPRACGVRDDGFRLAPAYDGASPRLRGSDYF